VWIGPAKRAVEALWKEQYKAASVPHLNPRIDNQAEDVNVNPFELWLLSSSTPASGGVPVPPDEYEDCCGLGPEESVKDSPAAVPWWCEPRQRQRSPNLHRMAVDLLSIPAMSAERERVFSECKRILTIGRHSIHADTFEVAEGLKSFCARRRL
jgi:hypothetical protein